MIRTEIDSLPTELDDISRRIMQLEIEEAALKKDDDDLTKAHLSEVQKELADQREKFNEMKARWESEKNAIGKVTKLREDIEHVNAEMEKAQRSYDLNRLAELQYGELPRLKKELAELSLYLQGKADLPAESPHTEWVRGIARRTGTQLAAAEAEAALRQGVAETCYQVLCDAGVYKQDTQGQAGLDRFLHSVFG